MRALGPLLQSRLIKSFSMPGYLTGLTEIRCIESPRRERRRGNKERERENVRERGRERQADRERERGNK